METLIRAKFAGDGGPARVRLLTKGTQGFLSFVEDSNF